MPALLSKNSPSDDLPRILEQKLSAFKEFLSTTLLLKEHLLSEDVLQIDSVISYRLRLINHIDNLDDRIKNITAHPDTVLIKMPPEKENQIDLLSTVLEETITKVIELNENCVTIATNRRDELGKELIGISNGRIALQGYAGGSKDNMRNGAPRLLSINA